MTALNDIFEAFGGPAKLGRAIGIPTEHATLMRRRGSIPPKYWPRVVEAAKKHRVPGVNYELLVSLHVKEGAA